jgi:hypothetical protein
LAYIKKRSTDDVRGGGANAGVGGVFVRNTNRAIVRFASQPRKNRGESVFRTCDPTQAHGAMSSPRSGPAKQNLQLAVASQNLQVVSSSLAAASAASAASSTPVKDAVLLQQDLARPDGWSHSGKSSHSLERAARFLSAASVAPAPRNTTPRIIAPAARPLARSGAPGFYRRRRVVAVLARVESAFEESARRFGEESVAREMWRVNLRGPASSRCLS